MKIYLAGPLFTQAEQQWLKGLQGELRAVIDQAGTPGTVIWPYDLATPEDLARWGERAKHEIFALCRKHLDDSDMVIALLDGTQVDDGTAWEIGYFYARRRAGQPILGIRTDFRKAGDAPTAKVNLMIDCSCDRIVSGRGELFEELRQMLSVD